MQEMLQDLAAELRTRKSVRTAALVMGLDSDELQHVVTGMYMCKLQERRPRVKELCTLHRGSASIANLEIQ